MAVLPQFTPSQAPDTPAELSLQGAQAGQSWMNQTQARSIQAAQEQRAQAMEQRQQAQFQAFLPALVAKSQADMASAQNDVASATLQQQLRGQWQSLKPQVIQDLASINDPGNQPVDEDGTPDWNARYNKYENLQAKYGALALLPEGKQYYQMIEDGKKNAFNMAMQHSMAQLTLDRLDYAGQQRSDLMNQKGALDTQNKPVIAQTEAANKMRQQSQTDIAAQRDSLSQMGYSIENMAKDIQSEQGSSLGSGPIAGSAVMGLVRPSVRQVQSDIGDFATKIMGSVKNIRNINEFRAVTANIPRADDQPQVQNEKLQKLREVNQVLTQRNELKDQLLQKNPTMTPDDADQRAVAAFPFPKSVMGGAATAPAADNSGQSLQIGRFQVQFK